MTDFHQDPQQNYGANNYNPYNNNPYGQQNGNGTPPPPRPTNAIKLPIISLVASIFATMFFCYTSFIALILAIIAVVYASQIDAKYNMGDYNGAISNAKNSKTMAYISLAISIVSFVVGLVIIIIYGAVIFSLLYDI